MGKEIFSMEQVNRTCTQFGITSLANATIGQVLLVARELETTTGIPFIRMDQGVPGMEACAIGIEAEKEALGRGVASMYPPAEGVPELKEETSRFIKAFIGIDIAAEGCIPVTGSVSGSFGAFIACNQLDARRNKVLFLDPGFPIQKSQLRALGIGFEHFDIYNYRGEKLREKLESFLAKGDISSIIYSNPNNPAWICLTESELKVIGELATKYDVVVLEDLAYFGMDFRSDISHPFEPPYQATVARYTDNYILMLSSSKIFSYAGQRMAVVAVSNGLYSRKFPALAERYSGTGHFGSTFTNAILYMITSGCTHSTQFGYAAMLRASTDGKYNFVEVAREYERRARRMKDLFLANGFHVVYEKDIDRTISDGFFFTIGYQGMSSADLMRELICFGISSITLTTTGSDQEGIRACCSRMRPELYSVLEERLQAFHEKHGKA